MTSRERMAEAMATWVRTLGGEYYELYNRHHRDLNMEGLKDAIERAIDAAVLEEREACAKVADGWSRGTAIAKTIRSRGTK